MTHLKKLRLVKWVSSNFVGSRRNSFCAMLPLSYVVNNPRFYGTKPLAQTEKKLELGDNDHNNKRTRIVSPTTRKEAEAALLDYLHLTRKFEFRDAEDMSKNSPYFLQNLLEKVDAKADVGHSVAQFLRYHPINEFEPFYESLGLKPDEYNGIAPRHLTFLSDDGLLLENYHVLHNYGIKRRTIGKICLEAREVFWYNHGFLALKLQAYQKLGLSQSFVVKLVASSPHLLIGDVNKDFIGALHILNKGGIEIGWIEQHLPENSVFNWSQLLVLLNLFSSMGYSVEQLGALVRLQPGIFFSGNNTLLLVGLLLKLGSTVKQMCSMFQEFPQIRVEKFISNFRRCFQVLSEIGMEEYEIGKIIRFYPLLVGSSTLKSTNTLLLTLNVGKERLCKLIQENPQELRNLAIGSKVVPFPAEKLISRMKKIKFLMDLGFIDKSDEMERALRLMRGSGISFQERFDCIVDAGLDRSDVSEMIKATPQILKNSKEVIRMKIQFLVNDLRYPLSTLVTFPAYLNFSMQRVELRVAMYKWLRDQGATTPIWFPELVRCSEKAFLRVVRRHQRGLEVFEDLKRRIYSL